MRGPKDTLKVLRSVVCRSLWAKRIIEMLVGLMQWDSETFEIAITKGGNY